MITLTREHNDWVKSVFGVDPSAYEKAPAAAPSGIHPPGDGGTPLVNGTAAPTPQPPAPQPYVLPPTGPEHVAEMDAVWEMALKKNDWPMAAKVVNGFSASDLQKHIAPLSEEDRAKLHQGALDGGIGPNSAVALATLDVAYRMAVKSGDWANAAKFLNAYNASDLKARLSKLSGDEVAKLRKGAVDNREVGPNSAVALAIDQVFHPILGSAQSARAAEIEGKLSPEDQKQYKAMLDEAKSDKERQYITKGLAANHSVADLKKFAAKIAGKDAKWLQDNLSLTGSSDGSGVKQQWHDSCGPTTFEAVQGELDPLYALDKHEKNPNLNQADDTNATAKNADLAEDQRKVLVAGGGVAVNRNQRGGSGRWIADALNDVKASTGLEYKLNLIGEGDGDATVEDGITAINDATSKGEPVPISIGNKSRVLTQHYVLVTASDPGPPRYYTIHDPWSGETVIRSEDQLRNGKLNIAGCNELGSFDKPTPVEVK